MDEEMCVMRLWTAYVKQHRRLILLQLLFVLLFLCAFALYHLPVKAVLYPAALCLLIGGIFCILDFWQVRQRHERFVEMRRLTAEVMEGFPGIRTIDDRDYREIIRLLCEEQKQTENRMRLQYQDMIDYYTIWAHQIKTPIASMRLHLQNEDTGFARKISEDLLRIEQYVDMVLCYLRLDSDSTDYVFREYSLDDMIKQAVRKFAGQFISRKLRLEYEPVNVRVVTDEKWLLFVLEQVLSNALKYTEEGTITIDMEAPKTLCIRDTGIGIAPEDLPRVFEKGYTGYNGRSDKKASGIGLYLCRRICGNLGYKITAESELDRGTIIRINLNQ